MEAPGDKGGGEARAEYHEHVLVVPKRHEPDVFALDETAYLDLMRMTKKVAAAVRGFTQPERVGMLVAGWDVPHAHVHVVPMHDYHDLTSKKLLEGRHDPIDEPELDRVARGIRGLVR